jgi:TIR domain
MPAGKVFICYRRGDSAAASGRIYDRLRSKLGESRVLIDVDSVPVGVDFRKYLANALSGCTAVIAVIGDRWLAASDQGRRRLDEERDFVRVELEIAFAHGIPVIPVLVGHAEMPKESELPSTIAQLAYVNALKVDLGRDFHHHVDHLENALNAIRTREGGSARRALPRRIFLVLGLLAAAVLASALLWRLFPRPRTAAFVKNATLPIVRAYAEELVTRFDDDRHWVRYQGNKVAKDRWVQGQVLAATLSTPESLSEFDTVLEPALRTLLDTPWQRDDVHPYPHVEPVLWTGMALSEVAPSKAAGFVEATKQFWQDAETYRNRAAWFEFPTSIRSRPSIYATALALLMLTDSYVAGKGNASDLKQQISEAVSWLRSQERYAGSELSGWPPEVGSSQISIGVSLLTAYGVLRASRQASLPAPEEVGQLITTLFRRNTAGFAAEEPQDQYHFEGRRADSMQLHLVHFTARPWAIGAAYEWTKAFASSASSEDKRIVDEMQAKLLSAARDHVHEAGYTFLLSEELYVLAHTIDR